MTGEARKKLRGPSNLHGFAVRNKAKCPLTDGKWVFPAKGSRENSSSVDKTSSEV